MGYSVQLILVIWLVKNLFILTKNSNDKEYEGVKELHMFPSFHP